MKPAESMASHMKYSRDLINSGLNGLRTGSDRYLHGTSLSTAIGQSALYSLGLAFIGACAGIVPLTMAKQHGKRKTLAIGALGCTLGFCLGFAWKTRDLARSMATDARKQMEATSDQHWLECHPIDYA